MYGCCLPLAVRHFGAVQAHGCTQNLHGQQSACKKGKAMSVASASQAVGRVLSLCLFSVAIESKWQAMSMWLHLQWMWTLQFKVYGVTGHTLWTLAMGQCAQARLPMNKVMPCRWKGASMMPHPGLFNTRGIQMEASSRMLCLLSLLCMMRPRHHSLQV